jgi:hypothetical protein
MPLRRILPFLLLMATLLSAQLNRGSITGVVIDSSAAAVPNARVQVSNEGTGATVESATNSAGQFNFPNLPTGTYAITVTAPNFKKAERKGLELSVSQVLRVEVPLEVGSVTETVNVSAEVPRVQTDSPEVGTSLSNKQMIDLPLNIAGARLVENFAYAITPGVSGNSWTSNINGSSSFSKETLLDGASVTTYLSGHFGESSVSMEALSEMRIQTSGMSAEFGRAQAGVFNYVMKSGTNQIHGSAYGMLRNEALNANTFANNARGLARPRDRHQNYAFSFGGPLVLPKLYDGRNKTFVYSTYERYAQRIGGFGAPSTTLPQPEFLDGNFSRLLGAALPNTTDALGNPVLRGAIYDPSTFAQLPEGRWSAAMFPNNQIPVSRFSQVSRNVLGIIRSGYLPTVRLPDGTIPLVNNGVRPLAGTPRFDQYQFSLKGDQNINSNHRVSASYSLTRRPRLLLDQFRAWDASREDGGPFGSARNQIIKSQLVRSAWDWNVSSNLLNNLTLSYNRMLNPNIGSFVGVDGARELGIRNMSTFGYPNLNFGGPFVGISAMGDPQNDTQAYIGMGLLNTTSFSVGRHFMKVGIDFRRNHQNLRPTQGGGFNFDPLTTSIPGEPFSGSQTGFGFASMLLGQVRSAGLTDPVGIGGRRNYYSAFFQDDFKFSNRLTFNLGLRWEFQQPFYEVADRYSSWSPDERDPISGLNGAYRFAGNCNACTGSPYFGSSRPFRDFGPRFGFAYRAKERLTVRGAYGIMFEGDLFNGFGGTPLGGATRIQSAGVWNLSAPNDTFRPLFNWDSGLPTTAFSSANFDRSYGNRLRPGMIHPNYGDSPYVQQFNLNLQTEVARTVIDVGYVGNKSTGLRFGQAFNLNQLDPRYLSSLGRTLLNPVNNAAQAAANNVAYPFPGFTGTVGSALRPYPQVIGNQTVNVHGAPIGFSTYHSMQITVNRQFARGFQTYASYTWSKNMTNMSSSLEGDNGGRPLDFYNLRLEKSVANDDVPHLFKVFFQYEVPFGRGRSLGGNMPSWLSAVIGNWQVSGILNYFSGTPLSIVTSTNPLPGVWNGGSLRANILSSDVKQGSFQRGNYNFASSADPINTYINKAAFADPAPLTLGTVSPFLTTLRGFGVINENFSLQKTVNFGERNRLQIRGDFLNGFNRPQWAGIQTNVTNPLFGQVTNVIGNRSIQLGARFDF